MEKERVIEGVIFDFDGVILNTDIYHYISWKKTMKKLGLNMEPSLQNKTRGVDREKSLDYLLEAFGVEVNQSKKDELLKIKDDYFKKLTEDTTIEDVFPGVLELIEWLKSNNYKIATATTSENAIPLLKKIGLFKKFDKVINTKDIKETNKLDSEILVKVCKEMGIPQWKTVGILGSQIAIDEANAILMRTIAIDLYGNLNDSMLKVNSTSELTPKVFTNFINNIDD